MKSIIDFIIGYMAATKRIPIEKALEIRRDQLLGKAPRSISPESFQAQQSGEIIRVREDTSDPDRQDEDELSLRRRIGPKGVQWIIRRVQELNERRSQLMLERAEAAAKLSDLRSDLYSFLLGSGGEFEHKRRNRKRLFFYLVLVGLGMFLLDAYTVADYITHVDVNNLANANPIFLALTLIVSPLMFAILFGLASLSHSGNRSVRAVGISMLVLAAMSFTAMRLLENFGGPGTPALLITIAQGIFFTIITGGAAVLLEVLYEKYKTLIRWLDTHEGDFKSRRQAEMQLELEIRHIDEQIHECERGMEQDIREFENAYREEETWKENEARESYAFAKRVTARLATFRFGYMMGERTKKVPALKPVLVASITIPLLFLLFGCGYYGNRGGAFYEVIADESSSLSGHHLNGAELAQIGAAWVDRAEGMDGGRFEILIVGNSFDDVPVFFSQEYPRELPAPISRSKLEWQRKFISRLMGVADSLPRNGGSAIAEAIYRASLRLPASGNCTIVVYSDLREVNGEFDFERRIPSYREFSRWLDANGITPQFPERTSLQVVGVSPYGGPNTSRLTAKNYKKTIELWHQVFSEWKVNASISETLNLSQNN